MVSLFDIWPALLHLNRVQPFRYLRRDSPTESYDLLSEDWNQDGNVIVHVLEI